MILKDLILKYEFDTIVPDLTGIEEPVKSNLYAFKEAFDMLRRMTPGDAGGEQIVVSEHVETDDDGCEVERYLHASNCEGEIWESALAKEVVLQADVTEPQALARILWHITFYGFTPEGEYFSRYDRPKNKYELKASILQYHQFCNYARVRREKIISGRIPSCALPMDEWDIYHAREARRNRTKRMRDARQDRQIKKYERLGKIQRLIDSIVPFSSDSDYSDYHYLFGTNEIREFEFYSRTADKGSRAQYIADNFCNYFNEDLTGYTRFCIVISSSEESEVTRPETLSICRAMCQRIGLVPDGKENPACYFTCQKPECHVHFVTDPGLGEDLLVRLVCSR